MIVQDGTQSLGTEELRALLSVSDALGAGKPLDEILLLVVAHAARLCGADQAALALLKGDKLRFLYQVGYPGDWAGELPISLGITGWVARNNRAQNVPNVVDDSRFFNDLPGLDFRSELAVPISSEGVVLGVLDVGSASRSNFDDHHQLVLEQFGARAAEAIAISDRRATSNKRLTAEIDDLRQFQDLDLQLSERLLNLEALLDSILELAVMATGAESGQILLPERGDLVIRMDVGGREDTVGVHLPLNGRGVTVKAFETREAIIVEDAHGSTWGSIYADILGGMNSELAVPIVRGDRCLGVLNLEASHRGAFKPLHRDLAARMVQRVSLAIDFSRRIDAMYRAARACTQVGEATLEEVLDIIYDGVSELFNPGVEAAIFLRSKDPRLLTYASGVKHTAREHWVDVSVIELGKGVAGRVVESRQTIHIKNVGRLAPSTDEYIPMIPSTRTSVGFPLATPEGHIIGAFLIESDLPDAFDTLDLEILEVFAGFVSTALSNHAFIARLHSARAQIQRASDLAASTAGLKTLGEITGNLVHHIVTDISSARQEIIHILQSLNPPGHIKASLLIARRNTSRVLALVNGLLDRIGDISDFEGIQVDVGQAIEDAINAKEVSIPRNIKLTKTLPEGLPLVRSTDSLHLVIAELIRNATKAIGRAAGEIVIEALAEKSFVEITVWNSGLPIPPKSQSQIFNFLYQAHSRRSGIGFGLYWAKSVIRGQGGAINLLFSDSEHGTKFKISLECADADGGVPDWKEFSTNA
jgi:putative methionine-R-sulfoxide reductase with GAF domain